MKNILVPVDFSDNAAKAAGYAAELASRAGAGICLLHVSEPVEDNIRQPFSMHDKYFEAVSSARKRELETVKQGLADAYPGIQVDTVLTRGMVSSTIAGFAREQLMDLIVMGTRGASGLQEIFMGSVTAGTIGHSEIPVLAVPAGYEWEEPDTILFATNHFEKNTAVLNKIFAVAKLFDTPVHTVVFAEQTAAAGYPEKNKELQAYVQFLRETFPGLYIRGELLTGKDFEETIETYDNLHGVDLIAMITYPKSLWEKLLKRSVTKKMAFHTRIPLLAVKAL